MAIERNAYRLVRHRLADWRTWRGNRVVVALCLALAGAAAAAQSPGAPDLLRFDTDLNVSREALDTRWSSVVRLPASTPDYSLASVRPLAEWDRLGRVPSLIEISPPHVSASDPQVIVRP